MNIIDFLPLEVDFNSASGPNMTYDSDSNTVTWKIGSLSPTDSNSVTLDVQVNELAAPNSAITNYCEAESSSTYNTAEVYTPVCYWCGDIIYVDANAPTDYNTGASWQNAYKDLQDALDTARNCDCNEIWVAAGTYKPTTVLEDWYATFELADGVAIYGGFAGSESSRNQRNWMINETILDGSIGIYGVLYVASANDVSETAIIDGFTIKKGWGAAIYSDNGSLTIEHNKIKENGYGIYCINQSSVNITNCEITDNVGQTNVDGGGIYCEDSNNLTVTDCVISKNTTDANGGGIYCKDSNNLTVTNCIITDNEAENHGGGVYDYNSLSSAITNCTFSGNSAGYGGAVLNNSSDPNITNCIFTGNTATSAYGGGMYNYNESMPTIVNCIFTGNASTSWDGSGMYNYQSSPTLINCTFSKNSAGRYGGGICNGSSTLTLTNCILWADTPEEIGYFFVSVTSVLTYCDVEGGWLGEGNIDADPCFADANNGDYHLKSQAGRWDANGGRWTKDDVTSPCIDAGDPMSPIGLEPFPNGGIINMGAYGGTAEGSKSYFGEPVCETIIAGDINGDCKVNFLDFRIMAFHWLEER